MDWADERDWLLQAKAGDHTAFGHLVNAHQTAVFNVAYRLLGRRKDAEDAAQEAFLRAFRALERFDVERPFAPWIKRITVNICYNWLESERIKPTITVTDLSTTKDNPIDMNQWQHTSPTPEQKVLTQERAHVVQAAILHLKPHHRVVIELRHFQGLSYAEIAQTLQQPLSNVKSDLFRARKQLAKQLKGVV